MRMSLAAMVVGVLAACPGAAAPLRVVATVPDLGSLVRSVGGDHVQVSVVTKGPQDPHAVEPRPSLIRTLHSADLFVLSGMELESGWASMLLQGARNPKLLRGQVGYLDVSSVVQPLQIPDAGGDRSTGDLHPYGNPHYLTDPVHGLRVAGVIRDRLSELLPAEASRFAERTQSFERSTLERLVGPRILEHYGPAKLTLLLTREALAAQLATDGLSDQLGGWLGALHPHAGSLAVEDHQYWAYFARRFGLQIVMTLEPYPGIQPSARQLARVVERMRAEKIRIVLSTAYFDRRHADWVAKVTGAQVVPLAHQSGSREGTADYLSAIDYNVRQLLDALRAD